MAADRALLLRGPELTLAKLASAAQTDRTRLALLGRDRIGAGMVDLAIRQQLTEIFHELFGDDSIVLRPEMTAADVAGWDSIKHISLIVAVEDQFGIKFGTDDLDSLNDVGALEDAIRRKRTIA